MIVIISVTMIVTIVIKLKWGWSLTIFVTKEHRPTGSQFAVKWCRDTGNLNKPSLLMWKCNTGSWFSRSRNCSSTCYEAGLKMLSNRLYSTGMGRFTSSKNTYTSQHIFVEIKSSSEIATKLSHWLIQFLCSAPVKRIIRHHLQR